MTMPPLPEVHVNDIHTKYRLWVIDEGGPFDPSGAAVKQLIFRMPNSVVLIKTATVETDGSPATRWALTYTVQALDGAGSPPEEFHAAPGNVSIQGYLQYADGGQWHSNVQTVDDDGEPLRVHKNLD